jgi:hypothetical protein
MLHYKVEPRCLLSLKLPIQIIDLLTRIFADELYGAVRNFAVNAKRNNVLLPGVYDEQATCGLFGERSELRGVSRI